MKSFLLIFFTFKTCLSISTFTQPLGISGRFLTTSIGIGSPPSYYDLALTTNNDEYFVLDYKAANSELDYQYEYIKAMFVPESSKTSELSTQLCRVRQFVNEREESAFGTYTTDYISLGLTMYGTPMRFCMLYTDRTGISTTNEDPLNWFFKMPVDGFLGLSFGGENPIKKAREHTGSNILTLWLDKKSTEPDRAGLITFGSHDTANCVTRTEHVILKDFDDWSFFVDKVAYGNNEDTLNDGLAVFDFTSDALTVPPKTFAGLKVAYGGNIKNFYCKNYKNRQDIVINTYGIELTLDVSNFVKPLESNSDYCELKIAQAATQDEIQLVFGKQLLKQFCLSLDYDNFVIGFAETKNYE